MEGASASTARHHSGVGALWEREVLCSHRVVAEEQVHVPVGGAGRRGWGLARYGGHLNGAGAVVVGGRLGVFVARGSAGRLFILSRLLHAKEPGAPVQ